MFIRHVRLISKVIPLMVFAFLLTMFYMPKTYAYNGGLLEGKLPETTSIPAYQQANMTDSNLTTYASFGDGTYATWHFTTPQSIKSVFVKQAGTRGHMRLMDANQNIIWQDGANTTYVNDTNGTTRDLNAVISGVYYIQYFWTGSESHVLYEFDVYPDAPDTIPPAVPSGLTGSPDATKVSLTWTANTSDTSGYNLYRDGVKVNSSLITGTSYTDTGLTDSTSYQYELTAVDYSGNESSRSTSITVMTLDKTAPAMPSGLTGVPDVTTVSLSWTANMDDTTGYNLYRDGVKVNSSTITGTSYTDTGLTPSTAYQYQITAVDAAGNESAKTSAITVTTSPIQLETTAKNGSVTLSWTPVSIADKYVIYRNGVIIGYSTTPTYEDTTVQNGTIYTYQVASVIGGVEQSPSLAQKAQPGNSLNFDGGGFNSSVVDALKTGLNFVSKLNGWVVFVAGLILSPFVVRFIQWLLTRIRKVEKKKASPKDRRKLTLEEREQRVRERRLNKARDEKYEYLMRSIDYLNTDQRREKACEEHNRKTREVRPAVQDLKGERTQRQVRRQRHGR